MYNTIDAINACNVQAVCIDMKFNATKSVAIRVVTHFNIKFAPLHGVMWNRTYEICQCS